MVFWQKYGGFYEITPRQEVLDESVLNEPISRTLVFTHRISAHIYGNQNEPKGDNNKIRMLGKPLTMAVSTKISAVLAK